jgi:hypothetical protein
MAPPGFVFEGFLVGYIHFVPLGQNRLSRGGVDILINNWFRKAGLQKQVTFQFLANEDSG